MHKMRMLAYARVFCHVCLGKECDIWETRDRRAVQWQPVISYSQLFERVVVIIVGRISAANSYRT